MSALRILPAVLKTMTAYTAVVAGESDPLAAWTNLRAPCCFCRVPISSGWLVADGT